MKLDKTSSQPIYVDFRTSGGTATAGEDFESHSGTLTFPPGVTSQSFTIKIHNDAEKNEGDEALYLYLSKPSEPEFASDAVIATFSALLTIEEDDDDYGFSAFVQAPGSPTGFSSLAYLLGSGEFSVFLRGAAKDANLLVSRLDEPPSEPQGFQVLGDYFDVRLLDEEGEKVGFSESTICFPYTEQQVLLAGVPEADLKLLHWEDGAWVDVTTYVDVENNQICGTTASFSPFAIVGAGGEVIGAGDTGDVTVIVEGAPLAVHPVAVDFGSITLNGESHDLDAAPAFPWQAVDPTGTGAGWHINLRATDFVNAAGKTISVDRLSIAFSEVAKLAGNEPPTPLVSESLVLSGSDQPILLADEGAGMGSYQFLPSFGLFVPANAYAGSYTATLTATIVAGP